MTKKEIKKRTVPQGFNTAVIASLGHTTVSSAYITMVRKGKRTNDSILMEIIKTDHNWQQIEHERVKRMIL